MYSTKIYKIDENNIDYNLLKNISKYIKDGKLVAIPTETVYGLACDGLNYEATKEVFRVKNRPFDNPLILHISNIKQLYNLVEYIPKDAYKLAETFWPGPLTMIFKKSKLVPDTVTCGLDTVAIRMPKSKITRAFIDFCNTPLAAPSANLSTKPSPTNASDVYDDLNKKIPVIIDGGSCDIGIESTVVDMTEKIPIILRPGFFTIEDIRSIINKGKYDDSIINSEKIPKSPGQKYKHYAPNAEINVYIGNDSISKIKELSYRDMKLGKKVCVLVFFEYMDEFKNINSKSLGKQDNLIEMSKSMFRLFRECDRENIDVIYMQGIDDVGFGKSIMNRLKKSSCGRVFNIDGGKNE